MAAKFISNLKELGSFRFFAIVIGLSVSMVWGIEQVVVARGSVAFQDSLNRYAEQLVDGKEKAVVLGSAIMMGGTNPVIRGTAQGAIRPDNPQVNALLELIARAYDLANIRIVDASGDVVAYFTKLDKSAIGQNKSSTPYYVSAMGGEPSMYAALGHTSGERGFYISAPIFETDATINASALGFGGESAPVTETLPKVVGVVVAKLGFDEVDRMLAKQRDYLAVVSPEGVIFATNVPAWQYRVLGGQKDLSSLKDEKRVNQAFDKEPPRLLDVDESGRLVKDGVSLQMSEVSIDWKDPGGSWRLVGFTNPSKSFGNVERFFVGLLCFVFVLLFEGWRQARIRVAERTLELEQANLHLEKLSTTDALTGLSNRRHFDDVLKSEWARASRTGQPLSLGLLDVDLFKKYNDHYGHQPGDECLRKVAGTLASSICRTGDLTARYGGEEFVFIAPDTQSDEAMRMAQKVCDSLQELALPHELSPYGRVSISIGVVTIIPDSSESPEIMVKRADAALYRAKENGRNRVELAN